MTTAIGAPKMCLSAVHQLLLAHGNPEELILHRADWLRLRSIMDPRWVQIDSHGEFIWFDRTKVRTSAPAATLVNLSATEVFS